MEEESCAFPSKARQSTGSADVGTQKSSFKKGDKKGRTRPKQSSSRRGTRAETLLLEMGCSLPNLAGIRQFIVSIPVAQGGFDDTYWQKPD